MNFAHWSTSTCVIYNLGHQLHIAMTRQHGKCHVLLQTDFDAYYEIEFLSHHITALWLTKQLTIQQLSSLSYTLSIWIGMTKGNWLLK